MLSAMFFVHQSLFVSAATLIIDAVAQVGVVLGPGLAGLIAPWGVFIA